MNLQSRLPAGAPVPSLTRWGLSPDADLVYRALATAGPQTIRGLAKDLGMSVRRTDMAIEELETVGAVHPMPVTARRDGVARRRWQAQPGDTVIATLRQRLFKLADDRNRLQHQHARISNGLRGDVRSARSGLTLLAGTVVTRQRIAQLAAAERHEHLAMNPETSFSAQAAAAALPLDRQLYARGIRVRTCGVPPADGDTSSAAAHELAALGGLYRERLKVPVKLMIFDRRVALLPADPLDLNAGAIEMDQPSAVAAMVALFEEVWNTASDPRNTGVPAIALTARERAIVQLLWQGHTDATAAKRLGLGQRTIGYALRGLMERLNVENRFQLGLVLGAAHAVTPPYDYQGKNK